MEIQLIIPFSESTKLENNNWLSESRYYKYKFQMSSYLDYYVLLYSTNEFWDLDTAIYTLERDLKNINIKQFKIITWEK